MRSYSDAALMTGGTRYGPAASSVGGGYNDRSMANSELWKPVDNFHLEYSRSFSPIPPSTSSSSNLNLNGNWFPATSGSSYAAGTTSSLIDLHSRSFARPTGFNSGHDLSSPLTERGPGLRSHSMSGFRHHDGQVCYWTILPVFKVDFQVYVTSEDIFKTVMLRYEP
jgi:hypothetical protein